MSLFEKRIKVHKYYIFRHIRCHFLYPQHIILKLLPVITVKSLKNQIVEDEAVTPPTQENTLRVIARKLVEKMRGFIDITSFPPA